MATRVTITYTCDSCGKESPRTEAADWYRVAYGLDHGDTTHLQACGKRCARLILIRVCNTDLSD